ncbi:MAG: hypothetical protein Greene041619_163 [Candidatus Peregrinibacteria bacterium Greene0416_19]|nr:MAG: hypothetical protein Greene041619_163 [Candidatus Peregrinibacteria bacterium Greene0416_19]
MSTLHPHWHALPEPDGVPPSAGVRRTAERVPVRPPGFSRRPAAVAGILVTLGIGYVFFSGMRGLTGQVAADAGASPVRIAITSSGVNPRQATVRPGQSIIWTNTQSLPHILQATDLKDSSGNALYTRAIFPGSEEQFTVSPSQPAGTYSYASITAQDVTGEIVVTGSAAISASTPSAPAVTGGLGGVDDVVIPRGGPSRGGRTAGDTSARDIPDAVAPAADPYSTDPAPSQEALIPRNPYTVDSTRARASSKQEPGAPAPPRPFRQPSTGPELWLVLLMSAAGSALVWRRMMHR